MLGMPAPAWMSLDEVTCRWSVRGSGHDAEMTVRRTAARTTADVWVRGKGWVRSLSPRDAASVAVVAARPSDATLDDWSAVACHRDGRVRTFAAVPGAPEEARAAAVLAGVPDDMPEAAPPEFGLVTTVAMTAAAVTTMVVLLLTTYMSTVSVVDGSTVRVTSSAAARFAPVGVVAALTAVLVACVVRTVRRHRSVWEAVFPTFLFLVTAAGAFSVDDRSGEEALDALADVNGWTVVSGPEDGNGVVTVVDDGVACAFTLRRDGNVWSTSDACVPGRDG